ncbi:MAG: GTP-binding protein, partial [Candidatus Omnitrophota bacterium]
MGGVTLAEFTTQNIRNVILLGHAHCGKTMLAEYMLFNGQAISEPGTIQKKTTVSDYNDDEKERQASINSSIMHFVHNNVKINVIDTPGFSDFQGEVRGGLRAVESAILVIRASAGIEVGTEAMIKIINKENIPCSVFINKMDKDSADFNKVVESLKAKLKRGVAVVTYPIGKGAAMSGVANLITKEGMDKLSDEDKAKAESMASSLTDAVAESDDALLEKYLEAGELSADETTEAFEKGVASGKIISVFAGSANKDIGVKELIEGIVKYMPCPAEAKPIDAVNPSDNEPVKLEIKPDGPLVAQVFKTISDPYVGQVNVLKVFSGKFTGNSSVYNISKGAKEKLSPLFAMQGKEHTPQDVAHAGDIIGVVKLKDTSTNDTLGDEKHPVRLTDIKFPEPAISFSIHPKTRSDEDKIMTALHKLNAEDPTIKSTRDAQTKELIVSGMGEFHINLMLKRMQQRFGVSVDM